MTDALKLGLDINDYSLIDQLKQEQEAKRFEQLETRRSDRLLSQASEALRPLGAVSGVGSLAAQPVRRPGQEGRAPGSPPRIKEKPAAALFGDKPIVELAIGWLAENPVDEVLTLYCGDGTKSVELRTIDRTEAAWPVEPPREKAPNPPPQPDSDQYSEWDTCVRPWSALSEHQGQRIPASANVYSGDPPTDNIERCREFTGPYDNLWYSTTKQSPRIDDRVCIVLPAGRDRFIYAYINACSDVKTLARSKWIRTYQAYLEDRSGDTADEWISEASGIENTKWMLDLVLSNATSDYDEGCYLVSRDDVVEIPMSNELREQIKAQMYFPQIVENGQFNEGDPLYYQWLADPTTPLSFDFAYVESNPLAFTSTGAYDLEQLPTTDILSYQNGPDLWLYKLLVTNYGASIDGSVVRLLTPIVFDSLPHRSFSDFGEPFSSSTWFNYNFVAAAFPNTSRCKYVLEVDTPDPNGDDPRPGFLSFRLYERPFQVGSTSVEYYGLGPPYFEGFIPTYETDSVKQARDAYTSKYEGIPGGLYFDQIGAWDWGDPVYCQQRLAELGIVLP